MLVSDVNRMRLRLLHNQDVLILVLVDVGLGQAGYAKELLSALS